ncbi:protein inturned-like isoform X1 [Mya arenaria]|uniref:protein inturned-like isoform X1 n=2 Tax=Mya arenaria TaxID=6604 RepID=UPI0022E727CC|nr:protein inturned-like isoform X1 [Mya arenaria]XP_052792390.1 protein inturned-like isoform X1 [Mya arenaria]XP_052792391.1 protein inturned-like isoform X1 [Mya arenaria]XP_052792392.1 protein inturned-like isoform X1 [Mya arenaria]
MFGLRVPLVHSLGSADFDGVHTILNHSCLKEPSLWLSKVNQNGEIFELQLEQEANSSTLIGLASVQKDCLCSCSDCATDDTGYGTDTDLYSSLRKNDFRTKDPLNDFNDVDDILNSSFASCFDDKTSQDFQRVEGDIDSLFQSQIDYPSVSHSEDITVPDLSEDFTLNIDNFFKTDSFDKMYTDVSVKNKSEQTKEKHNTFLELSSLSQNMSDSKKCECEKRNSTSKHNVEITVKLKPKILPEDKLSTVELCEFILGIVPGHYGSSQTPNSNGRKKDRRVKIRGLIPTGPASKYAEIRVGDCLLSINDQTVTWDNLDSVLTVLQYQRQAKLLIRQSGKQRSAVPTKSQPTNRLVQLVTGSNSSAVSLADIASENWEPFYGAMYLSLDGVNSDNMQAKEDIVYQFPRVDNKVIASRGMLITLAGSVNDATQSTVQSTTLMVDNSLVNIVYHCEGQNLFVISAPENRFSLPSLTTLIKDLVRLLQVTHGSIHQAFTSSTNHSQLDCFFTLLHQNCVSQPNNGVPVKEKLCNLSQSATVLTLPNEIKTFTDRMLTEFESADFGDMSDSYYGCRRSYNILGSCLFYKNYLISNHLCREDLEDFTTYLTYHSLLTLTADQGLGQLVVWREVYPTGHCHSVPDEQQFGYTEPLIARWFWLVVGYKNLIMCISLEIGGCTKVVDGVSPPDPFLIDQARAVLIQLYAQNMATLCQNSLNYPSNSLVTKPESLLHPDQRRHDLISRSLKKLPHKDIPVLGNLVAGGDQVGLLRRPLSKRKDSYESDNSSESSGESFFKFSRKGRLFPETADLLQNISEAREDHPPLNSHRKLTVGADNCLFHLTYIDHLEGVVISSLWEQGGACSPLEAEIHHSFQLATQKIKHVFDNARKVKEQSKNEKAHVCGLNQDFVHVREEGVMFTCSPSSEDKKAPPLCYWVTGRLLSRSMKREVFVCFHESTPQTVIELAFKTAMGYLPF